MHYIMLLCYSDIITKYTIYDAVEELGEYLKYKLLEVKKIETLLSKTSVIFFKNVILTIYMPKHNNTIL